MVNVRFKDINEAKLMCVINKAAEKWKLEHKDKNPVLILYFVEDVDFNVRIQQQKESKLVDLIPVESSWKLIKRKREKKIIKKTTSANQNHDLIYTRKMETENFITTHNRYNFSLTESDSGREVVTDTITTEFFEGELDTNIYVCEEPLCVEFVLDIEMRDQYLSWRPTMTAFKQNFPDLKKMLFKSKRTFLDVAENLPKYIENGVLIELVKSGDVQFVGYEVLDKIIFSKKAVIKKLEDLIKIEEEKLFKLIQAENDVIREATKFSICKGMSEQMIIGKVPVSKGVLVKTLVKLFKPTKEQLVNFMVILNLEQASDFISDASDKLGRELEKKEILFSGLVDKIRDKPNLLTESDWVKLKRLYFDE